MSTDLFSALADPTRRSILEMLAASDGLAASEIHEQFQTSPQAISQHLKILREANLVQMEKKAQQRIYRLNAAALSEFEDWSSSVRRCWNRRLDAMETMLREEMSKAVQPDFEKENPNEPE